MTTTDAPAVQQPLGGRQAETGGSPGDDGYGVFDLHLVRSFLFPVAQNGFDVRPRLAQAASGSDGALRENRGAGDGSSTSPSR